MPVIVVTVVTTGTDTLTAVAHGLLTGDRFRLRNVGGALPAATPALAGVTDYFALRVDSDNVKVCDTNAHALAGTGIFDITGVGSGTTTIEYGLPYCIPTALAAQNTQVKSENDNRAWNALVAIYDRLSHQPQSLFPTDTIAVPHAAPGFTASAADSIAPVPAGTTSPSGRHMPIGGLAVGRVITAVRARVADDGPTDKLVVLLTMYDPGTTGGPPAADGAPPQSNTQDIAGTTSTASAGSGVTETISKTGLSVRVVAGVLYNVCVRKSNGSSTSTRVLHAEIDVL